MSTAASELRAALHRARQSRRAIVDLGDETVERYRSADLEQYATDEEKQLAKQRAKDEATAKLPARIEDARLAREAARDEAARRLNKHKVTPEASLRVRRLLDEGVSLGEVLERA